MNKYEITEPPGRRSPGRGLGYHAASRRDRAGRRPPDRRRARPSGRGRTFAVLVFVAAAVVILLVGLSVGAAGRRGSGSAATVSVSLLPVSTLLPEDGGGSQGVPFIEAPTTDVPAVTGSAAP